MANKTRRDAKLESVAADAFMSTKKAISAMARWKPSLSLGMLPGVALLALSCAHVEVPPPVPSEERISIEVVTTDLTGTHADSVFSQCLRRRLNCDFLYSIQEDPSRPVDRAPWLLVLRPNPFRAVTPREAPEVRVLGDLERADYGPVTRLKGLFAGYVMLGLVGAKLDPESENVFIAGLQYRFSVAEDDSETPIFVRVAQEGDVRTVSRRVLLESTTEEAVGLFLLDLSRTFAKQGRLSDRELQYPVPNEREARKVLHQWTGITAR